MITIKQLEAWPEQAVLTPAAQQDFDRTNYTQKQLFTACEYVWSLTHAEEIILIAGVFRFGLIGAQPELWLAPTTALKPILARSLHFAVSSLVELYPTGLFFRTTNKRPATKRFAIFMGFNPVAQDNQYTYYEVH